MSSPKVVVLLLEDEPLIAMDVETSLRDVGYDVTTVGTCEEAREWLVVCRPDIAIVDVMLRDGSCHEIVRQIIADGVPFIVHSGDVPGAHDGTVFSKGHWLSKPALTGEIIRLLADMITKPQPPLDGPLP